MLCHSSASLDDEFKRQADPAPSAQTTILSLGLLVALWVASGGMPTTLAALVLLIGAEINSEIDYEVLKVPRGARNFRLAERHAERIRAATERVEDGRWRMENSASS